MMKEEEERKEKKGKKKCMHAWMSEVEPSAFPFAEEKVFLEKERRSLSHLLFIGLESQDIKKIQPASTPSLCLQAQL